MITLNALYIYPIKSCRGTSMQRALLGSTGLAHDRQWMLVDAAGRFLSQREHAHMATIVPTLHGDRLSVEAPGMPALQVPLTPAAPLDAIPVTVWDDQLPALDEGDIAGRWFPKSWAPRPGWCVSIRSSPVPAVHAGPMALLPAPVLPMAFRYWLPPPRRCRT